MDYQLDIIFVIFASVLKHVTSAYFNQTIGIYSFILSNYTIYSNTNPLVIAALWCQNNTNGYKILTIPSKEIQGFTQQFISKAISNGHLASNDMILLNGLRNVSSPWKWVNGKTLQAEIVGQSDPFFYYGYLQTSDFTFHASSHSAARPYICEFFGDSNCTGGIALSGKCYRKNDTSLTWYSARNGCLDAGGDLASLDNLNSTMLRLLLPFNSEYWIGLRRREWTWQDTGLPFAYTFWEVGAPPDGDDCLCLRTTSSTNPIWLWFRYCQINYRFICLATEVTTTSTAASETSHYSALSNPTSAAKTPENSIPSIHGNSVALPVGLGVGLGAGAILIIVIVVVVVLLVRSRKKKKQNSSSRQTPEAVYNNSPGIAESLEDMKRQPTNETSSSVEPSVSEEDQNGVTYEALRRGATTAETPDGLRIYDALEFHT